MITRVARQLLDLGVGDREALALGCAARRRCASTCRRCALVGEHHLDAPWRRRPCAGSRAGRPRGSACRRRTRPGSPRPARPSRPGRRPTVMNTTWSKPDSVSSVNMTPAAPDVAAHHALHAGGQRDVGVREALVHAIGDGAVVVERGEDLLIASKNVVHAIDIEKCFLLAGERGVGQVLGGGGRAHGERRVRRRRAPARRRPSRSRASSAGGKRRCDDPAADLARPPWRARRRRRRRASRGARAMRSARSLCARNSRKATAVVAKPPGTRTPRAGELADHFAERGVLAADLRRRRSCASARTG